MPSTPTKPQTNGAEIQLSQREIQIIAKAWLCIKSIDKFGVPKVDNDKLAKIGNYASSDSARVCWAPIGKKLAAMAGNIDNDAATPATPATPATAKANGAARKRKVKSEEDDEEVKGTPTKKPRGRKVMKREVKKEPEEDDVDFGDDEV
ncbi:hypothetical protein K449DRAFT_420571 [Hypoxylon sp. EC38]|nr:hypothetical protein K449DRAFT_420571 [Hypoxylon sp. EC38]